MSALNHLGSVLLPLLYGLAAMNYSVYLIRQDKFAERTCTPFLLGVFLFHVSFILARGLWLERHPIFGVGEALNVIAAGMTGAYLYVERIQRSKFTGAFLIGMVVLVQLAASTSLETDSAAFSTMPRGALFALHTVVAVFGYASFAVGAVYGVMYLLLYRALKRKRFGLLFERLPPLDTLSDMGFWAGFLGWLSLTVTIGLGIAMSLDEFPGFYRDPKFLSTIAVWVLYGGVALAHFTLGFRGARAVAFSLAGFVLAVLAMMGSNFLWASFHSFGA